MASTWVQPWILGWVHVVHISVFCVVFVSVLCFVCPMFSVSLECLFFIAPSVISNVYFCFLCGVCFRPMFSVWCLSVLCFLCGVCFRPMFPVWCLFPSYVLCVQCSLCLWSVYSSPSVISNVYLSEWYILRFYIMLQFVFLKIGMYLYDFLCRQI